MKLTKRQKRRLISAVLSLVLLLTGYLLQNIPSDKALLGTSIQPGYYNVIRVEDGDTITVDMNGKSERIRFIGIDTPETQDPRKPVQCFGKAASTYTKELIASNAVRLEADPLSQNRDRYNRLLRYVYLPDGRLVQSEIIARGYGFAYTSFPFIKSDEFKALENVAREQNKGLWASCTPETNKYGGHTSNPE